MSRKKKADKKNLIKYVENCNQPNNFPQKEEYCVPCECYKSNARWCKVYQYRQCNIRHKWNLDEKGNDVFAILEDKTGKKQIKKAKTPKRHRGR